ncbi:MAG: enoyl-CoA hydratase/isomerase family protein [Elusimicrobia bacterium]|nr:enoyl-CoA hydratase/isomerase family protein [Elusimicrobiota bacterium]
MTAASDVLIKGVAVGVMTLTLNRPKVSNALNLELLHLLGEYLKEAQESSSVRCVVLTGAGRAFSCGADLNEVERLRQDPAWSYSEELRRVLHPILLRMRAMEKPVVASVNGAAEGLGASLALSCDLKVASEDASFTCSCAPTGLLPCGLTGLLPSRVGLSRALELAWTARPVPAQEALTLGLVNMVVPPYRLESTAFNVVSKLLEAAPRCLGLTKKVMNRASVRSLKDELEYEAHIQDILVKTKDHAEGLAAVLERRPPRFTGE